MNGLRRIAQLSFCQPAACDTVAVHVDDQATDAATVVACKRLWSIAAPRESAHH
jgi:hypothetical protein